MIKLPLYLLVYTIYIIGKYMKTFLLLVVILGMIAYNYYDNSSQQAPVTAAAPAQPSPSLVDTISKWLVEHSRQK